ncbi:MAG: helix-turn-helix domain-containing protein [Alphaproteobacteria bacterium]|nr:helix-turn-helix domain-containing protein [Alphaproteobacteria bacterium]
MAIFLIASLVVFLFIRLFLYQQYYYPLDTEVLVQICRTLNCSIADLLKYIARYSVK